MDAWAVLCGGVARKKGDLPYPPYLSRIIILSHCRPPLRMAMNAH